MSQGSVTQRSWISNVNSMSLCGQGQILGKLRYFQFRSGEAWTLFHLVKQTLIRTVDQASTARLAVTVGMEADL